MNNTGQFFILIKGETAGFPIAEFRLWVKKISKHRRGTKAHQAHPLAGLPVTLLI